MKHRALGGLLGTVIGDALGRPFEGTPLGRLEWLAGAVRKRLKYPRHWSHTDDAEMMLALAESIAAQDRVDEAHFLETLWDLHEPARGYGKGVRSALLTWRNTGSWQQASSSLWEDGSRGNGGAVRVAPVAVRWRHAPLDRLVECAERSAAATHSHPEAKHAATIVALAIRFALDGATPTEILDAVVAHSNEPFTGRLRWARNSPNVPVATAVETLGHGVLAADSIPIALWAFARSSTFVESLECAVGAGGDTDSIGAICGAVAGATYGAAAIPETWLSALESGVAARMQHVARTLERRSIADS